MMSLTAPPNASPCAGTRRTIIKPEVNIVDFGIKKRDAKTGSKRERTVAALSMAQVRAGEWARGAGGSAHHFFIDGTSVCGRPRVLGGLRENSVRKLCPDCFAAVNRTTNQASMLGEL